MAAITRLLALFRRRRRSSSSAASSLRGPDGKSVSISSPTNFRREDITLGSGVDGNTIPIEQAREDALEMHKASKMQGLRKQARKVSAKFGDNGEHELEGDLQ